MVPITFDSPAFTAWAGSALLDGKVSSKEANALLEKVIEDGNVSSDEVYDLARLLKTEELDLSGITKSDKIKLGLLVSIYVNNNIRDKEVLYKAVPKALVREAENGLCEVDLNPRGVFQNPDLAVALDGEIIVNYSTIVSDQAKYQRYLDDCGLIEKKGANGVYRFYAKETGKEVSTLEAFVEIQRARFLDTTFNPPLTSGQKEEFLQWFKDKKFIPVETTPILKGTGPVALELYDIESKRAYAIFIPLIQEEHNVADRNRIGGMALLFFPSTYNEYREGFNNFRVYSQ
ncbi:MAG: hypothetical protein NT099_07810 [Candidatus Saganbacteria bacterium]|nr:hypothetical protein [Candidatus Saganbacteria bacterium]